MIISIVVAVSENNCIGKDNQLLWHLPVDMAYFKKVTQGGTVLMGRKTFNSIPEKFRPLPNRTNIVISRNEEFISSIQDKKNEHLKAFSSIEEGIKYASAIQTNELFIIGGADIYKQVMNKIDKIYLTHVKCEIDGDAYFEPIDKDDWNVIEESMVKKDDKNAYDCLFLSYQKK